MQRNTARRADSDAFAHLNRHITPTLQALRLDRLQLRALSVPVLTIHGRKDRQAPYGGGRDWARWLPDARLLSLDEAAHLPWIEAPQQVLGAIETFLRGSWPPAAHRPPDR